MNLCRIPCLILIVMATCLTGCSSGAQERRYRLFFTRTAADLVPGYWLPPESEYGPLWAAVEGVNWQTRDGSGRTKAEFWTSGEFNGDEELDYAYVLAAVADNERALYAFVSSPGGYEAILLQPNAAPRMWLATSAPGRYATAAAAGAGRDSATAVQEFESTYQGIVFFSNEGASSTFVWNETGSSFDRYWTSD